MRRKADTLLPLEASGLDVGLELRLDGVPEFHGFLIAKAIKDQQDARLLTAHGTLYKALDRMEQAGLLASRWEDPLVAAAANRPRRRLYQVTVVGEAALAKARTTAGARALSLRRGLAPS